MKQQAILNSEIQKRNNIVGVVASAAFGILFAYLCVKLGM